MMSQDTIVNKSVLVCNPYTREDLILFAETVCEDLQLKSLKKFLEVYNYDPYTTFDAVQKISKGETCYCFMEVTKPSQRYHQMLFDVMYVKKLNEIPLLINHGDIDIIPVVHWRFKIAK